MTDNIYQSISAGHELLRCPFVCLLL